MIFSVYKRQIGSGVCRSYRTVWPKSEWSPFFPRRDPGISWQIPQEHTKTWPRQSPGKWQTSLSWSKYPDPMAHSNIRSRICRSGRWIRLPKAPLFTTYINHLLSWADVNHRGPLHKDSEKSTEKKFSPASNPDQKKKPYVSTLNSGFSGIVMQDHI